MKQLRAAMSFGGFLEESSIDRILEVTVERHLSPGELFLRQGDVSSEVGFVDRGILRVYNADEQGEEVTKYFVRPNQFVVDLESFYNHQPSDVSFEAVGPVVVQLLTREVWNQLIEEVPKFFILTKSLTEITLLNKLKDNDFLNFGTASDKYREFLKRYPDLAREVPQHHIASYLKITPQSLSRIRRQLLEG